MKKLFFITLLLLSQIVQAEIMNTNYEPRHSKLIEKAIEQKCGSMTLLYQLKSEINEVRIDQGITDQYFTTTLRGSVNIDENVFDDFIITVESVKFDMYDHENRDWGAYSVESVNCTRE